MNEDFAEFLRALQGAGARFLVVGAHALAVHGFPRATGDLDVWIEASAQNADRVWAALEEFGAPLGSLDVRVEDLIRAERVIQIGVAPRRIDLLTQISGVAFDEAWQSRVVHEIDSTMVPFIGRSELVRNKRASGRTKDLADIEALGED